MEGWLRLWAALLALALVPMAALIAFMLWAAEPWGAVSPAIPTLYDSPSTARLVIEEYPGGSSWWEYPDGKIVYIESH